MGVTMLYVLIFAALIALAAVAVFVWTVVRSAVGQLAENRAADRRAARTATFWTADTDDDPDASVTTWPTYTDVRAVDGADWTV
jgi:hypothetical protein